MDFVGIYFQSNYQFYIYKITFYQMKQDNIITSGDLGSVEQNREMSQTLVLEQQTNSQCYRQYQRVFQNAKKISRQLDQAILTIQQLQNKLSILQNKSHSFRDVFRGSVDSENKRNRRKATDISRNYRCPYQICEKLYGSQASLKQHLKIKHSDKKNSDIES